MNVRLVKEWDELKKALDDTEFVNSLDYEEALAEMANEILVRLEASREVREPKS